MQRRTKLIIPIMILTLVSLNIKVWGGSVEKKPVPVKTKTEPAKSVHKGLGIGLRLYGGLGYIGGGDINPGVAGSLDLWGAVIFPPGAIRTGVYKPLHAGFNGGFDILVYLQSNWGITLGIDYLKASRTSEARFDFGSEYSVFTITPQVSAIPLKLGLFLEKPLGTKMNLALYGGAAYYLARFKYDLSFASIGYWSSITADTSAGGIGFNGGAALELELSKKLFFFIEALGRYARISGFTGTQTTKDSDSPGSSNPSTIYFLNANTSQGRFHMLIPGKEFPDDPDFSEVREAVIDFSGFSTRAGLRIKF